MQWDDGSDDGCDTILSTIPYPTSIAVEKRGRKFNSQQRPKETDNILTEIKEEIDVDYTTQMQEVMMPLSSDT
jgi:hypothetical protein